MQTLAIDGRALAAELRAEAARDITELERRPLLAVILAGNDPASETYVRLKEKACADTGVGFELHRFPADAPQDAALAAIGALNRRGDVDAILVQLPLPAQMDEHAVIAAIDPAKDADGFHPENVRGFLEGTHAEAPPLAAGILALAERSELALSGARVAILANSDIFAAPVRRAFENAGAAVEIALDGDKMSNIAPNADLIVTAIGRPGWLTPDLTRLGAVVIDVGTTRVGTRIVGDADYEGLQGIASAITPVPGGVGPVTVAMLIKNVVRLARNRR